MKKKLGLALLRGTTIVIFFVVSIFAVFFAYGYRLDFEEGTVEKTSIIDVAGPQTTAAVYLDDMEESDRLPFQFMSVIPGTHKVTVVKDGFQEWSRLVEVQEDLVSIVRDVLLVPSDLESYRADIAVFNEGDEVIPGDGYLLVRETEKQNTFEDNVIRVVLFEEDGAISDEEMMFYDSGFEVLKNFSEDRLLLKLENDEYALLSLRDRTFELFSLPSTVEAIDVDLQNQRLFFMESGNLYMSSFENLPEDLAVTFDPADFTLVHEAVADYGLTASGDLFFLFEKRLYKAELEQERFLLVSSDLGMFDRFEPYQQFQDTLFLLYPTAESEQGTLLQFDEEGKPRVVADNVVDRPFVDRFGRMLFADGEGVVFVYDPLEDETRQIRSFEGDFALKGWFDDYGHFLFEQEGRLAISDIYDENEFTLLEEAAPTFVHVRDGAFFWLEGQRLTRLYWEEAL